MVFMDLSAPVPRLPPLRAIGIVRTEYHEPESTPIQAAVSRAEHGTVELLPEYREGLDGLDGLADFGYAWLLTWLHNPDDPAATKTPAIRQYRSCSARRSAESASSRRADRDGSTRSA